MRHGGDLGEAIEAFGGKTEEWLDLSTGINPHAYPYDALLTAEDWARLPSASRQTDLLQAARTAYAVPKPLSLVAAPGTQVLISLLPDCLPAGHVHILGPTYASHAHAWTRAGHDLTEANTFEGLLQGLKTSPGHVVLVNPNNPDGRKFKPAAVLALAEHLRTTSHVLIIDEAFSDCLPELSLLPHLTREHNVLVLRSFGKFYGLAGLRLGFLAGPANFCGALVMKLDSWAISGPALAIGTKALSDTSWRQAMQVQLSKEMDSLMSVLSSNGLDIIGHTPLFVLTETANATALHQALARQRIWTRRFDHSPTRLRFGLPNSMDGLLRLARTLAGVLPLP
ncbi:threonine-phosphate decarboxylase CobD [Roseibium sp.]|uniref:threonine-phosphate decarboxylase CobD n=1 Tax=Roseibium sp. TaxID=1936156 RepID=UPI003A96D004